MYLTISSVLTAIFFCSILILGLCGLFKNNTIAAKVGPACMIGLLLAILVRLFVPFEFFYTYTIPVEELLTPIRMLLIHRLYSGNGISITVWHLLVSFTVLVAVVLLCKRVRLYKKIYRCISLFEATSLEDFCENNSLEMERFGSTLNVKVVLTDMVKSPYLMGSKNPYVLLPAMEYSKQQLYYILQHELMHVRNHDIVWKVFVDILCTVFWWNPVFWYLKKELFQMIEIRNDAQLVKHMTEEEQVEYMQCLQDMVIKTAGEDVAFSVSFSKSNLRELKRRLLLIASEKRVQKSLQVVLVVIVTGLLVATSAIIIEPRNRIEDESIGIPITSENSFLIKNGDTYDVYVDGEYLFNTDDLRPFQGVDIYNSIEEVQEND